MNEGELTLIEEHARWATTSLRDGAAIHEAEKQLKLVAEVRRYQAQLMDLKARAMDVRAFWRRHPGDHVVSQGISKDGEALLARIEALR